VTSLPTVQGSATLEQPYVNNATKNGQPCSPSCIGEGSGVSLFESGSDGCILTLSVRGRGVDSRRSSRFAQARVERAVGVVSGHDPLATHNIEFVLALQRRVDVLSVGGTDSQTELVERDETHPFLVEHVGAGDV
jgi:hypothetical protein